MRNAVQRAHPGRTQAPSATYAVSFPKCQRRRSVAAKEPTVGCTPRITRLLALAHKIDGMIRNHEIRDWAEAARLVGVTRARMTQIANLLLIAPEIQEAIVNLRHVGQGRDTIAEHDLRRMVSLVEWREQEEVWIRHLSRCRN